MEIKSVYLCKECRSMFNSDAEMAKHLEGKNWDNLDCPKCGKLLESWRTVSSLWMDFKNTSWLQKHGALKSCWREDDEHNLDDDLVDFVLEAYETDDEDV